MQKGRARQGASFYKLHGAGNDLLVVESRAFPRSGKAAFVRRMAHRNLGIGCDQLIELQSTRPLEIQIWNCDGSQAEMCANGSRTFLFLAAREGWIPAKAKEVPLRISGKPYVGRRVSRGNFELCLGEPVLGASRVLRLGAERIPYEPVTTGNPHVVIWMTGRGAWKPSSSFDYRTYGAKIETHRDFPAKTNVEFLRAVRVRGPVAHVAVEAWERGAGATLSCGSGAVAVAAAVRARHPGVRLVKVRMTEFELRIRFEGHLAYLSGPCALVAKGVYFFEKTRR